MKRGPLNPKHGTAGTAAVTVLDKADGRSYVIFQNVSDTDMWLALGDGEEAVVGLGILVPSNGGFIEFSTQFVVTNRIRVVCGTNAKAFSCYEG